MKKFEPVYCEYRGYKCKIEYNVWYQSFCTDIRDFWESNYNYSIWGSNVENVYERFCEEVDEYIKVFGILAKKTIKGQLIQDDNGKFIITFFVDDLAEVAIEKDTREEAALCFLKTAEEFAGKFEDLSFSTVLEYKEFMGAVENDAESKIYRIRITDGRGDAVLTEAPSKEEVLDLFFQKVDYFAERDKETGFYEHRGYTGFIEYDFAADMYKGNHQFDGLVSDICGDIYFGWSESAVFKGKTIEEARKQFCAAIDDYIMRTGNLGKKSFFGEITHNEKAGKFRLRVYDFDKEIETDTKEEAVLRLLDIAEDYALKNSDVIVSNSFCYREFYGEIEGDDKEGWYAVFTDRNVNLSTSLKFKTREEAVRQFFDTYDNYMLEFAEPSIAEFRGFTCLFKYDECTNSFRGFIGGLNEEDYGKIEGCIETVTDEFQWVLDRYLKKVDIWEHRGVGGSVRFDFNKECFFAEFYIDGSKFIKEADSRKKAAEQFKATVDEYMDAKSQNKIQSEY